MLFNLATHLGTAFWTNAVLAYPLRSRTISLSVLTDYVLDMALDIAMVFIEAMRISEQVKASPFERMTRAFGKLTHYRVGELVNKGFSRLILNPNLHAAIRKK